MYIRSSWRNTDQWEDDIMYIRSSWRNIDQWYGLLHILIIKVNVPQLCNYY